MKYLLMEEYEEMKVYALDNVIYHKIEKKVITAVVEMKRLVKS